MSELILIIDQLNRAFKEEAWHGPSVLESLSGISEQQAANRSISQAHSIWELTLHIGAWKNIVNQRLRGVPVKILPEVDWPVVGETTAKSWQSTIDTLKSTHEELILTVQTLKENQLYSIPPGGKTTPYFLLHGVVQHDVYHAGQIMILRKSQ